jgi:hypothetical protein
MWLGLLPGVLAQMILGWLVYALDGSSSSSFIWIYLPMLLVNITLGLSLIILMGLLVRRTVVLVIIWVMFWLALSILRQGIEEFRPFQEAALINFNFGNLRLSPSLGLGLYQPTVTGMLFWFLGIALLGIWLTLLFYPLLDSRRALQRKWFLLLGGLVSAGMLAVGVLTTQNAGRASAIPVSPYDIQLDRWRVLAQTLEVIVDTGTDTLQGSSSLTLTAEQPGKEQLVVLKLNPGLEVVEISTNKGEILATKRVGDSLIITLTDTPQEVLKLNLTWQGKIQVTYSDYQMRWQYQAPLTPRTDMPQPIGALLLDNLGFLTRDGDWYPWPWTISSHQADQNRVTIHVKGDVLILPSSDDQTLHWEGNVALPPLLLVLPPRSMLQVDGINTYISEMSNAILGEQMQIYASAIRKLWVQIEAPMPKHIVVMPYIGDILLSEDLLVVPDGSSYYHAASISGLFGGYASSASQSQIERTLIAALTRQWIFDMVPPSKAPYLQAFPRGTQAAYQISSFESETLLAIDEMSWKQIGGRWVQPLLAPDVSYFWSPRLNVELNPPGELSAVAAWLAIELAGPDVRQQDLTIIQGLNAENQGWISGTQRRGRESALLPFVLDAREARDIVLTLHEWAEVVGIERAVQLTFQTIQETRPQQIQELFRELEAQSGVPIQETEQ